MISATRHIGAITLRNFLRNWCLRYSVSCLYIKRQYDHRSHIITNFELHVGSSVLNSIPHLLRRANDKNSQVKMKTFSLLICVCFAVIATAYEQYIGNARHPDHPGKCYHEDTHYAIEIGEVYRPVQKDVCAKYTCRDDFVIRIDHCPRYMVPDGCKVSRMEDQPYPKCCAVLHCADREGNVEDRPTAYEPL